ncbi:histidine utilization repressor [Permianibacter aggregans]|uniref:Histidine utilization repressor n=1 Tax=Permianibacter aggregans TaxID=1510150 RepID=A0A4R6UJV6_9GAMM|nr:histidine utilization repressor [Permianibacter aggregans]TDQ46822.1 GntR family histidine utilization transcriptional repressor [Permianibacter aggregans]
MSQKRYQSVIQYLSDGIAAGTWPVDAQVPSENELVAICGVSRMTARRALEELTEDGVLYRVQGKGTFVAPPKMQASFVQVRNIADEVRALGQSYANQIKLLQAEVPPAQVRELFQLEERAPAFHSIILHLENKLPVQLEDRWVHPNAVPEYLRQDFQRETPNVYLSRVAPLTAAEHVIEAHLPDLKLKRVLQLSELEACLVVRRTTWSGPQVISYATLYHPGTRYRLAGRIGVSPSQSTILEDIHV